MNRVLTRMRSHFFLILPMYEYLAENILVFRRSILQQT